jgi:hypothetical protein
MRRTASRAHEGADHIDVEDAGDARGRHLVDPGRHVDDAGVVDEAAQRAEFAIERAKHRLDGRLAADVGLQRARAPAALAHLPRHAFGGVGVTVEVHADVPAGIGRPQRAGRADAAAGAGDEKGARCVHAEV